MSSRERLIEKRHFIRHPTDTPITYQLVDVVSDRKDYLKDVSRGGLCFRASVAVPIGSVIEILIPICDPVFEARGVVVWTQKADGHYDVGVRFEDEDTEFSVRMVEQVCHIEQFKKDIFEKEGRVLTCEEAALEWIEKYAKDFPR